jgi:hypothetical protein
MLPRNRHPAITRPSPRHHLDRRSAMMQRRSLLVEIFGKHMLEPTGSGCGFLAARVEVA